MLIIWKFRKTIVGRKKMPSRTASAREFEIPVLEEW